MTAATPTAGDALLLIGTRKGALLMWRSGANGDWQRSFHHEGWEVDSLVYDQRDGSIYAATTSPAFASFVQRSRDLGQTWEPLSDGLDYPAEDDRLVSRVWTVQPGPAARPGRLYAGVEHAGLFISDDEGEYWRPVDSLNSHPSNRHWQPGGGGLMAHHIVTAPGDPARLYVGISAGGFYRSDDDGESWRPLNRGVAIPFAPDETVDAGHCVHRFVVHPAKPEVIYQQNHAGAYRSDDRGEHWVSINDGLPSDFGFAIEVDPNDPDTIFVVPLAGPERRIFPDGAMQLWRSRDRGQSWAPLSSGLPDLAYFTVMRASLATDAADPAGVYVGTTGGHIFHSPDAGDRWELLAGSLARVLSVSTAVVR